MENSAEFAMEVNFDGLNRTFSKFLTDPKINPELKMVYLRLAKNPRITRLVEKTSTQSMYAICEEYQKYPNLYDDIFDGRIKICLEGNKSKYLSIFNHKEVKKNSNLRMYFGPNTLIEEVAEKFIACDIEKNKINKITIKLKEDKILTAGYNPENKLITMFVDLINTNHENNIILNFLHMTKRKKLDIIKF